MAENSKIEWTHHTFNPWRGCTKVSPGCANCYAETLSGRNPKTLGVWGPNGTRVVASETMWREPLKWDAKAAGERHRVFCASLADVFEDWQGPMNRGLTDDGHPAVLWHRDDIGICDSGQTTVNMSRGERHATMADVRRRLFRLPTATPNLDWLFLTKRPENIARMMPDAKCPLCKGKGGWETGAYSGDCRCGNGLVIRPNVWLGVSVENQEQADKRIPILLKTPAAVRFLSMEPLLGPVDLHLRIPADTSQPKISGILSGIHWVIVGGESGHGARPMHPDWVRSIRDQCQAAGVPFFFKQWGEWIHAHPAELHLSPAPLVDWEGLKMQRVGKRAAGRLLDGREWSEIP